MTSPSNPAEHQPVVAVLERYYTAILGPFEEAYRKNIVEQQQRARQQGNMNPQARPGMIGMPGQNMLPGGNPAAAGMMPQPGAAMDGSLPGQFQVPQLPFHPPNTMGAAAGMPTNGANHPTLNGGVPLAKIPSGGFPAIPGGAATGSADLEHDLESRKRKMQEAVESDAKRVRQKTGTYVHVNLTRVTSLITLQEARTYRTLAV